MKSGRRGNYFEKIDMRCNHLVICLFYINFVLYHISIYFIPICLIEYQLLIILYQFILFLYQFVLKEKTKLEYHNKNC